MRAQLTAVCPGCGHANPPGNKFCSECGADLYLRAAAAKAPPGSSTEPTAAGERRFVSVLFADLVGFTPFSESRDPEEVRSVLTAYFDRAREIIERFGGTVDKFIGDAVAAFWGATIAHEDDAERAVRAALELVDTVAGLGSEIGAPDLRLRAGVLSGETSVGSGGNEQGLVVGDIVNTASRLQSVAAPGTVLVGESTQRLTQGSIQYEELGDQALKGKTLPVPAWRALRVVAERGGRGRTEGLEAPFVGREDEFRLLKDQLHATDRESRARLVSVMGEAGIGKSRLAWELLKYIDGLVENVYYHQGRSPAHGEGLTFWALGEMVRSRAGIAETDDAHRSRTRLRTTVAEYVENPDEQRWIEPRLAGLLGLEPMPAGDRPELFGALRAFFHHVSRRGTTVLVFEDLHWADAGLLEFIEELVDLSQHQPILVVTLARPDLLNRAPGWGAGRRNFLSVHLGPLADEAMTELVAGLAPGIPQAAVAMIRAKAAGVPLYAVEFVRMLVADGTLVRDGEGFQLTRQLIDLAVPESLHSVIGARLDGLDPDDRSLLQDAAVLGQAFTLEGLMALRREDSASLERRLRSMVRKEMLELEDDPRSPERGQYLFVQSLIREVAYGRLAKPDRRARHLAVASFIESLGDLELAPVVASHYLSAHQATPKGAEADELAARARGALRNAVRRASDLHSHQQALSLVDQALAITTDPTEQAQLWEIAAASANALIRVTEAIDHARRALGVYGLGGDGAETIRAATLLATILSDHGRPLEAVAVLEPIFEAQSDPSAPTLMTLTAALARAHMLLGEDSASANIAEQALVPAELAEDMPVLVDALITRATALSNLGRVKEGTALLKGAIDLAEAYQLPRAALRAINNLLTVLSADDRHDASRLQTAGLEQARRIGDRFWIVRFAFFVAMDLVDEGRFDQAVALLNEFDPSEMDHIHAGWFKWGADRVALLRGEVGALDRAVEALSLWKDDPDPRPRRSANGWRWR